MTGHWNSTELKIYQSIFKLLKELLLGKVYNLCVLLIIKAYNVSTCKCTMKSKSRFYIQPNSVRSRCSADNFLYMYCFPHSTRFESIPLLPRSHDSLCVMTNYLAPIPRIIIHYKIRYINRGDTLSHLMRLYLRVRHVAIGYTHVFVMNLTQHLKLYTTQDIFHTIGSQEIKITLQHQSFRIIPTGQYPTT